MARIQYERPDGSVGSQVVENLTYDAESGHWLLFSHEDQDVIFIPRERVYFVEESESEFEDEDDDAGEGW